jgi:non-specific serine/threonine protein kinase
VADARNSGNILIMLADVVLLQEDPEGAHARALASLQARDEVLDAWVVGITLTVLGRVAVATGDPERAAQLFGAAEARWTSIGAAFMLPPRWRDDYDQAVNTVRDSLDDVTFASAWQAGRAMTLSEAVAHAERADRLEASDMLSASRAEPAVPARARGAYLLTPREHEVAVLITEGLTNGQIAAELVLSERTVDTHAEHIRSKLDVRTRAEISAWVARHLSG